MTNQNMACMANFTNFTIQNTCTYTRLVSFEKQGTSCWITTLKTIVSKYLPTSEN